MSDLEFREELKQFCAREFPYTSVNLDKIMQLMAADIAHGGRFVSWSPKGGAPVDNNTGLVVTTRSVSQVKTGMFKPKVSWSLLLSELKDVGTRSGTFNGYPYVDLYLEAAAGGQEEFRFGFHSPGEAQLADASQKRAQVVARQIASLKESSPGDATSNEPLTDDPVKDKTLRFLAAISFVTDNAAIGRPFGPGHGLELVRALVRQTFDSIDDARESGFRLGISMITTEQIGPEDASSVMGASALDDAGLTKQEADGIRDLGEAAMAFLAQINRDGANIWELWKRNDEVAEEFLCWHAVAWGRLTTLGKVPPI